MNPFERRWGSREPSIQAHSAWLILGVKVLNEDVAAQCLLPQGNEGQPEKKNKFQFGPSMTDVMSRISSSRGWRKFSITYYPISPTGEKYRAPERTGLIFFL